MRRPRSNTYVLTPDGQRVAIFYTKLHNRLLRPLAAANDPPEGSEGTKGRYASRYGDFTKVDRAALIHAKQRASQNDHDEIAKARRQPPLSCRYCVLQNCLWTELALRPDHYFAVRGHLRECRALPSATPPGR